jgi:hypothetical protein
MPADQPSNLPPVHGRRIATATGVQLPADWDLVSTARANVLLVGERVATGEVVDAVRQHIAEPLIDLRRGNELDLTSVHPGGTAILVDVDGLVLLDQQLLKGWLEGRNRTRVISTSRVSLLSMVEAGMFLGSLYYRLNTLCFDVRNDA